MKILVYVGHPAQYHFMKNALKILKEKGHSLKLLIKTKDVLESIAKEDGWEYENIQPVPRKSSKLAILMASFRRTAKVMRIAKKFQADLLIGEDSSIAQSAKVLRKTSFTITEDDYEVVKNWARLTFPFSSHIVVPTVCRVGKWERKKIGYDGYMKMAYLHPHYFTPNEEIIKDYNISGKYVLVRLAKLTAFHDKGIKGLSNELVNKIIDISTRNGYKVYISSEVDLDSSLESYRLKINPKDIHHIMAFSSLLISDSQSMSVEAAMLGVPSLRFSDFAGRISVLEELEKKYGLTFGIPTSQPDTLIGKLTEVLENDGYKEEFARRHKKMMNDKIDVTAFLVWLIENYPTSVKQISHGFDYMAPFKNRF